MSSVLDTKSHSIAQADLELTISSASPWLGLQTEMPRIEKGLLIKKKVYECLSTCMYICAAHGSLVPAVARGSCPCGVVGGCEVLSGSW